MPRKYLDITKITAQRLILYKITKTINPLQQQQKANKHKYAFNESTLFFIKEIKRLFSTRTKKQNIQKIKNRNSYIKTLKTYQKNRKN